MSHDAREPITVAVFHSMFGLRQVERTAADRLRAAGHRVVLPDLFDGAVAGKGRHAPTPESGFALMTAVGWDVIVARALDSLRDAPADTVLCGMSMGAGVIGSIWPERPAASAAVLLHAPAPVPPAIHPATIVQVHVADGDPFATPDQLAALQSGAARAGADVTLYTYPHAGHFFTDTESPDHHERASELAWSRVLAALAQLRRRR